MNNSGQYTAFIGDSILETGSAAQVGVAVKAVTDRGGCAPILIFDDHTGRQIDFDLRGTSDEIERRYSASTTVPPIAPSVGRPKLGVKSREVTLLPRHWEWLMRQKGGASAELRRLVDASRRQAGKGAVAADVAAAADRFMLAMTGNLAGYEEAARALYRGDHDGFLTSSEAWPKDLRDYARRLAAPAFTAEPPVQSIADLLVSQFGIAWALAAYHLDGLTTEECLWRPAEPCLHVTPAEDGSWRADWPEHEGYDIGPPSIAWTSWHICFWWTKAIDHAEGKTDITKEDIVWPGDADRVRDAIFGLRDRWLKVMTSTTPDELAQPSPASWPLPESSLATIAAWLNVELMKNASEIGLVRFLYAARHGANGQGTR